MTSEIEEDLRTTAEAIIADAATVTGIEQEKLALHQDDPRRLALADQAEIVAERLLEETRMERALAEEHAAGVAGD